MEHGHDAETMEREPPAPPFLPPMLDKSEITCNTEKADSRTPSDMSLSQFSPLQIAYQFAEKASCHLSTDEVANLINFLQERRPVDPEAVREIVNSRYDAFCQAEIAVTGESGDRLAAPSGPVNATLSIQGGTNWGVLGPGECYNPGPYCEGSRLRFCLRV
jgi:hypothetical protein